MIREFRSPTDSATAEPPQARSRKRGDIDNRYKWNLSDIFPDWDAWEASYAKLDAGIDRYAALKGTLSEGPSRLLSAFELSEELGQLAYRVWYYPSLRYDEDQRDNAINARRQKVQILFAKWKQAESWFSPELLAVPLTHRARVDGYDPGARDLPVRDRGSLPAAGARPGRGGRTADVLVEPPRVGARATRMDHCPPRTRGSRPSRSRMATR